MAELSLQSRRASSLPVFKSHLRMPAFAHLERNWYENMKQSKEAKHNAPPLWYCKWKEHVVPWVVPSVHQLLSLVEHLWTNLATKSLEMNDNGSLHLFRHPRVPVGVQSHPQPCFLRFPAKLFLPLSMAVNLSLHFSQGGGSISGSPALAAEARHKLGLGQVRTNVCRTLEWHMNQLLESIPPFCPLLFLAVDCEYSHPFYCCATHNVTAC